MSDAPAPVPLPAMLMMDTTAVYSARPPTTESLPGFYRYDPDKGNYVTRDRGSPARAAEIRRFDSTEAAVTWLTDRANGTSTSRAAAAKRRMEDPEKRALTLKILDEGRAARALRRRNAR